MHLLIPSALFYIYFCQFCQDRTGILAKCFEDKIYSSNLAMKKNAQLYGFTLLKIII